MEKRVCIVNFNTPELVRAAILSLWKHTPDAKVTVFDNSTITPCFSMDGVDIIDNTRGGIIDFDEFLSRYPSRTKTYNEWGSAKHCYTVQYLFDLFPAGFVLLDSDVLVKKDISCFFKEDSICAGEVQIKKDRPSRLAPFICWINPSMAKQNGIKYFDENRNWKLFPKRTLYDTGASFLEDCVKANAPKTDLLISEYIIHFNGGSWRGKEWETWLKEHEDLYIN